MSKSKPVRPTICRVEAQNEKLDTVQSQQKKCTSPVVRKIQRKERQGSIRDKKDFSDRHLLIQVLWSSCSTLSSVPQTKNSWYAEKIMWLPRLKISQLFFLFQLNSRAMSLSLFQHTVRFQLGASYLSRAKRHQAMGRKVECSGRQGTIGILWQAGNYRNPQSMLECSLFWATC